MEKRTWLWRRGPGYGEEDLVMEKRTWLWRRGPGYL